MAAERASRGVAAITGTTSGIGAELAVIAAEAGYDLILVNRSLARTGPVQRRIAERAPGREVRVVGADMADPGQVRRAADEVAAMAPELDLLINNAGVLRPKPEAAPNGVELHFQVNVLAPYLLTRLLRGPLQAAGGTVVNVSSGTVYVARRLKLDRLRELDGKSALTGAYARSKLALTTLTNAMSKDHDAGGVTLRSVDPGANVSGMTTGSGMPWLFRPFVRAFGKPPSKGAGLVWQAATDPELGKRHGVFLSKGKIREPPKEANDPEVQRRLLALCRELTGA